MSGLQRLRNAFLREPGPWLLPLLPLALILPAVADGSLLLGLDYRNLFLYNRAWVGSELGSGRLPAWDPHAMAGFPLLAALQSAVFYPATWLTPLVDAGTYWALVVFLHMTLAGLFAHAWLRRGLRFDRLPAFAGAAVFMLCGFFAVHRAAGHVNHVMAFPWLAAACWRLERFLHGPSARRWILLGLCAVMPVLAGVPQFCLFSGLALAARGAAFVAARGRPGLRVVGLAAASLLWASLLAAPQILPTLELIPFTQRAAQDAAFASSYSLPPENLLALCFPSVLGDGIGSAYIGRWNAWETGGYVGVAALALAALGLTGSRPQRFLWGGLAAAALLLALGRYAPFFDVARSVIPGVGLFRGPGRFLALFTLALAPLVAMGVERMAAAEPRFALRTAAALAALGILFSAFAVFGGPFWTSVIDRSSRAVEDERPHSPRDYELPVVRDGGPRHAARAAGVAAAAALVAAGLGFAISRGVPRAALVLALLPLGELLWFAAPYSAGRPREGLTWSPEFRDLVSRSEGGPWRIASADPSRTADLGRCQVAGLDHAGGFEPMMLSAYADAVRASYGIPLDRVIAFAVPPRPAPLTKMLGVRYWIGQRGLNTPAGWTRPHVEGGAPVFEDPGALPRAWVPTRILVKPRPEERLAAFRDSRWDPAADVLLEAPPGRAPAAPAGGSARVVERSPGRYRVEASLAGDGLLVLSEAWFPGWEASVDGAPADVLRANHFLQAVELPAGRHDVVFEYRSTLLGRGFLLAAVGLLAAAGLVVRERLGRARPATAPGRAGP